MSSNKKNRRKQRQEWTFEDFRTILDLPERLAQYLREMLHLDKSQWDFCLDRIRQFKTWQVARKEKPDLEPLPKAQRLYFEWSKSKGRGKGRRYFAAPCAELKVVQKAVEVQFLKQIPIHFCRHGSQEGSSILTNVRRHANFAVSVFSADIVNAFPSVFRSRMHANLKKPLIHRLRQFSGVEFPDTDVELMLNTLCDLLCLRDRLPQGPSTSPRILAIVSNKMDMDLYRLCDMNSTAFQSYRLTIYADNITISSNGEMPAEIRELALKVMRENGFIPHMRADKTKYFSPETGELPVVTGLVINQGDRITMAPGKVNQLRAALHHLWGLKTWNTEARGKVAGYLGYIRQVYPNNPPSALRALVAECEQRLQTMRHAEVIEQKPGGRGGRKKSPKRPRIFSPDSKSAKRGGKKPPSSPKDSSLHDVAATNGHVEDVIVQPVQANVRTLISTGAVEATPV